MEKYIKTARRLEATMNKELPLVMGYTDCETIDQYVRYKLCWTERAKTINAQNAAKKSIYDFAEKYGAIEIRDNNINCIYLAFPVDEE